jgi:phosphate transport system permease protein
MALPLERDAARDESAAAAFSTPRRRLLFDRLARWWVTFGGVAIIAGVLGILFFILAEVAPLLRGARVEVGAASGFASDIGAIVGDPDRTFVAALDRRGVVRASKLNDSRPAIEQTVLTDPQGSAIPLTAVARAAGEPALVGATADGRAALVGVDWTTAFGAENQRSTEVSLASPEVFALDPSGAAPQALAGRRAPDGSTAVAAQLADGRIVVVAHESSENAMTGEKTLSETRIDGALAPALSTLVLDGEGEQLIGGTASGQILYWRMSDGSLSEPIVTSAGHAGVTAIEFLLGDRAIVVGQADGALSVWFPLRQADDVTRLVRIRDFPSHTGAIRQLAASRRNKGFLAADERGGLGLYYSTSGRTMWRGQAPMAAVDALVFSPKADGAVITGEGKIAALEIDNPHPEVSWGALFGKTWYEGYDKPEYAWQSTGGTDDFEPKLGMVPLLVGTLKGTFYSLLLAIPLGILGAMYASQFMHPRLLRVVKPTVEIMAALPSVVLGFLAGLWLAPALEKGFPALLAMIVAVPPTLLLAGALWRSVPRAVRARVPAGGEVALYALAIALAAWACLAAAPGLTRTLFGGDFQAWLAQASGLHYDQRNAVVVGLAMGFAVVPIIFAIAEDAFSNVPRNLVSGSLALGANRWQTVTRVVLPTASPGIFSAVMIGFGRAVGETMIVLMATGNTPIMSWNPFNGFRTLSANVAVEMPEAPQGGTLFRTLFLAALLLFLVTFIVNTLAELVRQRLRRRYAEL